MTLTNICLAQKAPNSSEQPWEVTPDIVIQAKKVGKWQSQDLLASKSTYSLIELVDIAERQNPETKQVWLQAKQKAASLGIAQSELYPTLALIATATYGKNGLFFDGSYFLQNTFYGRPMIALNYTLFDFGARHYKIDAAKAQLLTSNLMFNDTHRRVIYRVTNAYYRLLLAKGQKDAAVATLMNAKTVEQSVQERLDQGLATLPDVLEAQAASASAEYELAAIQGAEKIAHGELASSMGASPTTDFEVQDVPEKSSFEEIGTKVEELIEESLSQRPDFLAQAEKMRSAEARIHQAKAAYFPQLNLSANYGHTFATGSQDGDPYTPGQFQTYTGQLTLDWNLFDGGKRKQELTLAKAAYDTAKMERQVLKDEIENQVWQAYTNIQTANRQLQAANLLFSSANKSYEAALESYHYGVRNFIDVTTAQKTLAQARTRQVTARIQVMLTMLELTFQTGDLLQTGKNAAIQP